MITFTVDKYQHKSKFKYVLKSTKKNRFVHVILTVNEIVNDYVWLNKKVIFSISNRKIQYTNCDKLGLFFIPKRQVPWNRKNTIGY